ncbi:hypothetical protein DMA11_15395 [Marinilabiliaceae bacterium JC017]|nr:hypothetical protein DMA11_15395 [Marinilabiliaceae bacterium JC017]
MKKVYYLRNCNTCKRILKEVNPDDDFEMIDIKTENITEPELDKLAEMTGNYESLFNKQARKYRELGLNQKSLNEDDFRSLILEDYTFLRRPVFLIDDKIFVGNKKDTINQLVVFIDQIRRN